jgi:hypothetical protein
MYKVYFLNFGYASQNEGSTLEEAKAIARKAGFQSAIYSPSGGLVGTFCPITGFKPEPRKSGIFAGIEGEGDTK